MNTDYAGSPRSVHDRVIGVHDGPQYAPPLLCEHRAHLCHTPAERLRLAFAEQSYARVDRDFASLCQKDAEYRVVNTLANDQGLELRV